MTHTNGFVFKIIELKSSDQGIDMAQIYLPK